MNNRHHWQLKNQNSGGCFNSSANLANSPQKWAKWAELAVLFSWQFQNGHHNFDFFFQFPSVPIIYLDLFLLSVPIFMHNNSINSIYENGQY
jgi:hypothetical protein